MDFAPCQSTTNDINQEVNQSNVKTLAIQTAVLSGEPSSSVPKLPTVLQSIPVAVCGVPVQPIYIAPQTISDTNKSIRTTISFITPSGQTVAPLTSEQLAAPQTVFQTPQLTCPSSAPQKATSESNTTIPASTDIPAVPIVTSNNLSKARDPSAEPTSLTVSALVSSKTSPQTLKLVSFIQAPKPPTQIPAGSSHDSAVFPRPRIPHLCAKCGAAYKVVQALRGYLCQCNPQLVQSVETLSSQVKKKKHKVKTLASSDCLKNITTSEIPEGAPIPGSGDRDENGKLIMLVEDFYYGEDPGKHVLNQYNQVPVKMKCNFCKKRLKNNIKLMNHMKHHMENELKRSEVDFHTMCQHCFRRFGSPFSLQCHIETVHSEADYPSLCKICELSFDDTPLYLNHMKNFHKAGEMPYICEVCMFRSSFYQNVINHFKEVHRDTNLLLCLYCLKVFKSSSSYQLHFSKHQKKSVLKCKKCRLQFLYAKDRAEHRARFHQTHRRPKQLKGVRFGTKVTIRSYAITKVKDSTTPNHNGTNCERAAEVLLPTPEPPKPPLPVSAPQTANTNRKPVESLLTVMIKFQNGCDLKRKYSCLECNFDIPDFSRHFPTFVRCSLCRYHTCCSRAYANHMISSHAPRKTKTKYLNLYKDCPKFGKLSCCYYDCDYTTVCGDFMARHIAKHPGHTANCCKVHDGFSAGYKRFVFIPTNLIQRSLVISHGTVTTLMDPVPMPIQPVSNTTPCINLPPCFAQTSSFSTEVQPIDEQTVTEENSETQTKDITPQAPSSPKQVEPTKGGTLTLSQFKIVLYALCSGIHQAANQFDTQPKEIQTLLFKHQSHKLKKTPTSQVDEQLVEWVLCQREQQLPVDEDNFFSKASEFSAANGWQGISYEWAADFLINHELSLQALPTSCRELPHKAQERMHSFSRFTNMQLATHSFDLSAIGAMDELSIFIDMEQLDPASADSFSMLSAFKLAGDIDPLIDVVLAVLADGTMLPIMVFLKGEPLRTVLLSLPESIILEARPDGFLEEERLQLWFDKVWSPHVNSSHTDKRLLVIDAYKGHLEDNFLKLLYNANTIPNIIPPACSSRLQPLEACVGLVLRDFLQARWNQHVTESPQDLIGAEPVDLALLFSVWLLEMFEVLEAKPELLQRSFEQVLSSTQELAPALFPELVRNLTEALIVNPFPELECMEEAEENSFSI